MFMDIASPGGPGGEPFAPMCHGCRKILAPDEAVERIEFAFTDDEELQEMNGIYHARCAKPIVSVKRAYDMMQRWSR